MSKRFLLDTHALVMWNEDHAQSRHLTSLIDDAASDGRLYSSIAALWEISLLVKKGRLVIADLQKWFDELESLSGICILPIRSDDLVRSINLPDHHKDPFDRIIIAQAAARELTLVTNDSFIKSYSVETLW